MCIMCVYIKNYIVIMYTNADQIEGKAVKRQDNSL